MNTQINITQNGTTTLATAGKYCDRNIDVVVNVSASAADIDSVIARTATEYTNDSATSIGAYAFYSYTSLTSVSFASVTGIGDRAFYGAGLKKIIRENFPKPISIGTAGFATCKSLESIELPQLSSGGGNYVFNSCPNLKRVKIDNLSGLTLSTFEACPSLQVVDLGNMTSGIAASVFSNDTSLTTLIIRETSRVVPLTLSALNGTPIVNGAGYVYVPSALVDSYKAATNWTTVQDQIRAIEDYPEITGG